MAKKWRVKKPDGKIYGNADTERFERLIKGKKIVAEDIVTEEGSKNWVKCSQVPEFASLFKTRPGAATSRKKSPAKQNPGKECPQCNALLEPDVVLCVNCGADLRPRPAAAAAVADSSQAAPESMEAPGRKPWSFAGNITETEVLVPAALLTAGLIAFIIAGFMEGGVDTALGMLLFLLMRFVFVVALGIPACFLVAKILGTSFGLLHTAVLKLAAIAVVPPAAGMLIPFAGGWIGWILYFFKL